MIAYFRFYFIYSICILITQAASPDWVYHQSLFQKTIASQVKLLQFTLNERGFPAGPVDGIWGPKSKSAIHNYLKAKNPSKQSLVAEDSVFAYRSVLASFSTSDSKLCSSILQYVRNLEPEARQSIAYFNWSQKESQINFGEEVMIQMLEDNLIQKIGDSINTYMPSKEDYLQNTWKIVVYGFYRNGFDESLEGLVRMDSLALSLHNLLKPEDNEEEARDNFKDLWAHYQVIAPYIPLKYRLTLKDLDALKKRDFKELKRQYQHHLKLLQTKKRITNKG